MHYAHKELERHLITVTSPAESVRASKKAAFLLSWGEVKKGKGRTDQIAKGIQAKNPQHSIRKIKYTQYHIVVVDFVLGGLVRKPKVS